MVRWFPCNQLLRYTRVREDAGFAHSHPDMGTDSSYEPEKEIDKRWFGRGNFCLKLTGLGQNGR